MKKVILRTVVGVLVAYGLYSVLALAPAWLPSLPALPKLPLLDPQQVLASAGLLPEDVAKQLDKVRNRGAKAVREAVTQAAEQAAGTAGQLATDAAETADDARTRAGNELSRHRPPGF